MVDLALLQSVSYIAGAVGVCLAAAYYIINLGESRKNRKITLTTNLMQMFQTPDTMKHMLEFLHMEWNDYGDFEAKYGTENNIESASVRLSMWQSLSTLGELLRVSLVDEDTIYSAMGWSVAALWQKFESVVKEHRKRYMSIDQWSGFEYLGDRMYARISRVDSGYKIPATYDKFLPNK